MPYWKLFYHAVWSTKNREPFLMPERERIVIRSIRTTLSNLKAIRHAIGGTDDHIHVALSIPPSIAIAVVVARMKGASTHAVNDAELTKTFPWQSAYGVVSFGEKALPDVVAYVDHQRERHLAKRLWPTLEVATDKA
jgi:putative transposase